MWAGGCATATPRPVAVPASPPPPAGTFHAESFHFGRFDAITFLAPDQRPRQIVLFLSGREGFHGEARQLGEALAAHGAAVAVIDLKPYDARNHSQRTRRDCIYPAIDFQTLAKRIEKELDFPDYVKPVLVGYRESGSMVVTALAETPPDTFAGAVTVGFCSQIDLPVAPCPGPGELAWQPGDGGRPGSILPPQKLPAPWITLAAAPPVACPGFDLDAFVAQTPLAEIERTGDASSKLQAAVARLAPAVSDAPDAPNAADPSLAALPLLELPATAGTSDSMAVMASGDGGWADLDQEISDHLNKNGIPVVGWNSLRYFWSKRTPEETARALQAIVEHYSRAWHKRRVILIGYSLGAEVLADLTDRLPQPLLERVRAIALIGPGQRVDLEFHLSDWLSEGRETRGDYVLPELRKLRGLRILCFEGDAEKSSLCPALDPGLAQVVELPGGHHFGGDYPGIARAILEAAP